MKKRPFLLIVILNIIACFYAGGCASMKERTSLAPLDDDKFEIKIYQAYKDDFGDIRLKGMTSRPVTIYVDDEKITEAENNRFNVSVDWDVGEPILIKAVDKRRNTKRIKFWPDREPPEEPKNLRVVRKTPNLIEIEWSENREPDIKGYIVYYGRKGGSIREVPEIIEDNHYEIIGVKNFVSPGNRIIRVYVRSIDQMRNESYDTSDILEVTIPQS